MRLRAMILAAALMGCLSGGAGAQSTVMTYQGKLADAGAPAAGLYDMRFRRYDSANSTNQLGAACVDNVTVTGGVFTVSLDFGPQFIAVFDRYLEIDVRRDTGLTCANTTGYTTLAPRQQVTPAPRAQAATTANGLAIPNGSSVVVNLDNNGHVGMGVSSPQVPLHVLAPNTGFLPGEGVRIQGTIAGPANQSFFSFHDGAGTAVGYVGDGSSGDNNMFVGAYLGDVTLITSGGGRVLTATSTGRVGIGTTSPASTLDVRGDIRLGSTGQQFAIKSDRNDRTLRGTVNTVGTIGAGTGFTVSHTAGSGIYVVNFNTAFATAPTVVASSIAQARKVHVIQAQTTFFTVGATDTSNTSNNFSDGGFTFFAIGE